MTVSAQKRKEEARVAAELKRKQKEEEREAKRLQKLHEKVRILLFLIVRKLWGLIDCNTLYLFDVCVDSITKLLQFCYMQEKQSNLSVLRCSVLHTRHRT